MVTSFLQAVREGSTGELPQEVLGAAHAMNWKDGWPEDGLRHSYGSYHLAKNRNAALTAEQMGHKNARMLYAHYREVVKNSDDITSYWTTFPSSIGKVARFAA